MPKILINEKDNTSPGTPGSYANYSVLIAGYMGRTPVLTADAEADKTGATVADKIQPDSNGVYEFSSKQDFEDTIGFSKAEKAAGYADITTDVEGEVHYGKRMAHALLNMGYSIIYVPIKSILEEDGITSGAFWELFEDKASYDFRFISHGLLETNYDKTSYDALVKRLDEIKADVAKLEDITNKAMEAAKKAGTDWDKLDQTGKDELCDAVYQNVMKATTDGGEGYTGFIDPITGKSHEEYTGAKTDYAKNSDEIIPELSAQEKKVADADAASVTPGTINNVNGLIAKLASYRTDDKGVVLCGGRGDCVALIELYESCYVTSTKTKKPEALIIEGIQGMSSSIGDEGAYCAMTVPSVYYKMSDSTAKFPGAFHYLACFMGSLSAGFAEWYAAAGYTRGVSSYTIDHTSVKLGEIAINALEPRYIVDQSSQPPFACNVIANFRGSYYLWGNRTAYKLQEEKAGGDLVASHFLNIRQLCSTIKKQIYVACRRFTFDPNSDTLWFNFVNAITPTLDLMKADQGIRDYRVLKVFTDKKATLKAKIRIIPIEAVEDFDIEVSLEDSFGGVSVAAN